MAAAAALGAMITVDDAEIEIVVETGTLTNTVRASDLAAVLLALQRPFVGALWDPGNGVYSAMDPDPLLAYGTLREWIRHVHVKDPLGQSHYAPIGRGSTPWKEIVGRMATDGYRGYLSLETHWRRERILSKEELDCPWGNTFSAGGKEASSLCMAALKDVVEAECDRHLR
jgi:sugar phosphate isomerase/epimerase